MKEILMCLPEQFEVIYDINYWMHNQEGLVDIPKAVEQWYNLFNALTKVAVVNLIDGVKGLPDLVFTANAGIIQGNLAVLSRFTTTERQPEELVFRKWFLQKWMRVVQPIAKYEGEGDHLRDNIGRHWMGSGFRTEKAAAAELEVFLNTKINILELVDPRWYHLDTCFCPLPMGEIMWYPGAFSLESQTLIRSSFSKSIEVSLEDALLFCCNCICLDNNLFMPQGTDIMNTLFIRGYDVWEGDLSEFLKAGGAAKCLVLEVR